MMFDLRYFLKGLMVFRVIEMEASGSEGEYRASIISMHLIYLMAGGTKVQEVRGADRDQKNSPLCGADNRSQHNSKVR